MSNNSNTLHTINDSEVISQITLYINQYRNLHNANDLLYDKEISNLSQLLSIKLLKNKKIIEPDILKDYTLIKYLSLKCRNNKLQNIKKAINTWYNENKLYLVDKQSNNFTGLVWKSSTKFGLGYSYVNGKCSVCLLIYEKGNIPNEIENNVFNKLE